LLPANPRTLFDDFFSRELFNWGNNNYSSTLTTLPSVNIRENPENFVVEVAAPGMEKQDFQISLEGNLLTISSSKKMKRKTKMTIIPVENLAIRLFSAVLSSQEM
jgi:HSP20 family protein